MLIPGFAYASEGPPEDNTGSNFPDSIISSSSSIEPDFIDPEGNVTSWMGWPVRGATVSALQNDTTIAETITDENGHYSLQLPEGHYRFIVTSPDYVPANATLDVSDPVTLNFELIKKNSIYGKVTDIRGIPIPHVNVKVLDFNDNFITDTFTDPEGRYLADVTGYLNTEDFLKINFSGYMLSDVTETVFMGPDDAVRLDYEMDRLTILTGFLEAPLTLTSSLPVDIYYGDEYGMNHVLEVYTESSGYYSAELSEDMASRVMAIGFKSYGYSEYFDYITLNISEVNIKNISLSEKAVLNVTAVGTDGSLIEDVLFLILNDYVHRMISSASGRAALAVEEGEIYLTALKESYRDYHETLNITREFTDHRVTLIRKAASSGVEGHVIDAMTGNPIVDAAVDLRVYSFNLSTYTDENGYYCFSGTDYPLLIEGTPVELSVQSPSYRTYQRSLILPAGTLVHDIDLERLTTLRGRISDPDGKMVPATLKLSYLLDGSEHLIYGDLSYGDDGTLYLFHDIPASDDSLYLLSAEHWFYQPFTEVLSLNSSEDNIYDIVMGFYGGELKIKVTDRNGTPLQGVILNIQGPGSLQRTTSPDGTADFLHLPDHEWIIGTSYPGYAPANLTVNITDGGSEQVLIELIREGLPATLQGHVYDTDGNPLSGVIVRFWPSAHPWWTGIQTSTDTSGFYELSVTDFPEMVSGLTGILETRASHYRGMKSWMIIDEGVNVYDCYLELCSSNITLRVTDSKGNPLSNITVYASCPEDRFSVTTSVDGTGVLNNVPASEYWYVMSFPNDYFDWDGYYYVLGENQNITIDIILVAKTAQWPIKGRVMDNGGSPIAGARVEIQYINGNTPYINTFSTDSWGEFRSYGLTANLMKIIISRDGYITLERCMVPGELPFDGVFVLETETSKTGRVEGYVRDFTDSPLEGVLIVASKPGFSTSTFTDPSGYYSFQLPAGNYILTPYDTRYIIRYSVSAGVVPDTVIQANFTLLMRNSVYGHVNLINNSPASGATVELYNSSYNVSASCLEDGRYQLQAPAYGEYNIRVSYPFYIDGSGALNLTGGAVNEDFLLQYGPFSGIHGGVTDKSTGNPLEDVLVILRCWRGEDETCNRTTLTDNDGAYSFSSLQPIDYHYTLDFIKDGYVPLYGFHAGTPGIGEDLLRDVTLQSLLESSVSGTLKCWAGLLEGTVTLDDAISTQAPDGYFEFRNLLPGWHFLRGSCSGSEEVVYFNLSNGQHLNIDLYFITYIMERNPPAGSYLSKPFNVSALLFGGRPGATGSMKLYSSEGEVPGTLSWNDQWIIFTPSAILKEGQYTAEVNVAGELSEEWKFNYYPVTENPPRIVEVRPADGSFYRMPSSIDVNVNVRNDPGNGLSELSGIYMDGIPLQTSLSGGHGDWQLTASINDISHGWHNLMAVAIDNQGLEGYMFWRIFTSNKNPEIYNLEVTPSFSPGRQLMHITADIDEPLRWVIVSFEGYPYYSLDLGSFTDRIDGYWDGFIRDFMGTRTPPEGPISFTITGYAMDYTQTNPLSATTLIDRTGPEVITDIKEAWNTRLIEIMGHIYDPSGILSFNATSSAGEITSWTGTMVNETIFGVTLSVPDDGKYNITLNATDMLGNSVLRTYTLLVDTAAPEITFSLPEPDSTVRPGQTITFNISDLLSGFSRGHLIYHSVRYPELTPWNIEVLLDGNNITKHLIYSQQTYTDIVKGNTPYGYDYLASLQGVHASYQPRDHGFLADGNHRVTVKVLDRAGNSAARTLTFSSKSGPPDIVEKDMDMTGAGENETLMVSFDVKENSDRGFGSFKLEIDGVKVNVDPTIIPDTVPYMCTVIYTVTSSFQQGPHNISFLAVDGHGLSKTLKTGFYHIEPIPVPLENIRSSSLYRPDFSEYSGSNNHLALYDNSKGFKAGEGSIYGYCDLNGPDSSLLSNFSTRSGNLLLPMGGQLSFTVVETPFMECHDADFLSLWMTDIDVKTNVYWGWGAEVLVYFNDGRGIKLFEDKLDAVAAFAEPTTRNPSPLLYAKHEAPWVTWSGILDTSKASAIGADGKIWKHYNVKIPDGLDKSHLSVVFVWETNNWFQNRVNENFTVSISSRISNLELLKTVVDYTLPEDGSVGVPLNCTITAHFNIPMDPDSVSGDAFHILKDGFIVNGTASYSETLNCAYFKPSSELGGLKLFTGYVGPEIRTIYGRVLPSMTPYTWTFTTARGYPTVWEEIVYNGEKYCIVLVWGPGYGGGKPAYLGSTAYLSSIYGDLLEINVLKYANGKYYEVTSPEIRNTVFLGALRKSFYDGLTSTNLSLIDQAQIDYVKSASSSLISNIAYYSWLIATFGQIKGTPDADDVIRASITSAIGSGIYQIHVPGYFDKLLTTFSTSLTAAKVLNDAYIQIGKWLKTLPAGTEKNTLSGVLDVLDVLDKNLKFQKEIVEYIFTIIWQLEVAETYRPQLMLIRDQTSGDTREAITQLLTWDESSIMSEVSGLVLEFYVKQGLEILKSEIQKVLMKTPAMPAVIIMKGLEKVVNYLQIFEFRSQASAAGYMADANKQFIGARKELLKAVKYYHDTTPWDYALLSMASGLCYSTATEFFETRTEMTKTLKRWPSLIAGTDPAMLEYLQEHYAALAANYREHTLNIIPEITGSNRDLSLLLPFIKAPTTSNPTYIHIGAFSPVTILIKAPDGRRIGYDPLNGVINDFGTDAFYNSPYSEPQAILLPMMEGEFKIQVYGVANGNYRIILEVLDENMQPVSGSEWTGKSLPGKMRTFSCFVDESGSSFRYDTSHPLITVTGVKNGGVYTGTVRPRITITDDNLESWVAILNGDLYAGKPVSAPGTYYMIIRASDGINIVYSMIVFTIKAYLPPEETNGTGGGGFTGGMPHLTAAGTVSAGEKGTGKATNRTAIPMDQDRMVDYTWLLVSLLLSVLIAGLYSATRKK